MEKIKVILDTDLGSDCDDAGALALLHNLEKQNRAKILAVTHCATEIGGAVSVKAINEYYGNADIPVGRNQGEPFLECARCKIFTPYIMEEYLKSNSMPEFEEAVRLMRRMLVENRNVTIISIGILNNICGLLKSPPDDISLLSGYELIEQSVDEMYVMGGHFENLSISEHNIACDILSARYVADNFPKPIVYCGFEIGEKIRTGKLLKGALDENPVKKIYSIYSRDALRESWDPITAYAAVEKNNEFLKKSSYFNISFDDDGKVRYNESGKDCFLILNKQAEEFGNVIDKLIV